MTIVLTLAMQADPDLFNTKMLPPGVRVLSEASQESLRKAREKAAAAEARFVKRGA